MFHPKKIIFEKAYVTIALNVLCSKREETYPAYVSKHNSNREKQVILLMISNGKRQESYSGKKKAILQYKNHQDYQEE